MMKSSGFHFHPAKFSAILNVVKHVLMGVAFAYSAL